MSFLFNNPKFSRIVEAGLEGIEDRTIRNIAPTGPSNRLVDYMHLAEFKEILENTKSLQQVMAVNPLQVIDFTKEKQTTFLCCLLTGVSRSAALKVSKIKPKSLDFWLLAAEKGIQPFYDFVQEMELAEGLSEVELVQMAKKGGAKYAVELLKIKQAYELAGKNPDGKTNAPAIAQQLNINVMQLKPDEKRQRVEGFFSEYDSTPIISYPVKPIDKPVEP